eukprot:15357091-Alexandrium_andersonii.AAC.1
MARPSDCVASSSLNLVAMARRGLRNGSLSPRPAAARARWWAGRARTQLCGVVLRAAYRVA